MQILAEGVRKLGLEINDQQINQFQTYLQELTEWNRRVNLTGIKIGEEVQRKHFLDSLTIVLAGPIRNGTKMLDLGTGAGFPGLPLKILFPDTRITLLEATGKKAEFLGYIVDALRLSGVEIATGRAENFAHQESFREKFDLVFARSVTALPALVELGLPFTVIGGIMIAMKTKDSQEVDRAGRAINIMGGKIKTIIDVEIADFPENRCLIVIDKIMASPACYPRRPGIPSKKPIE